MKALKKFIVLALIFALSLTCFGCDLQAKQYEASPLEYFSFAKVNGGYEVAASGLELPEKLNIPEEYQGLPVVAIADGGFAGAKVKEIAIPKSITEVRTGAFKNAEMEKVYFYNGTISIGDAAFFGCKNLKTITLPKTLETIGQSAFNTCTSLTSIVLPEKVKSIGNSSFAYCVSLDRFYIPKNVEFIGENVFVGCLENLTIEISASNEHYKLDVNGMPVAR